MKTETKEREKEILDGIKRVLLEELNPGRILLFGSRAKKETKRTQNSDFDIAVSGKMPEISKFSRIKDRIESVAGLYKVDIVFLDSVDSGFRDVLLEESRVIYEQKN
jgi:predicted nucleotidyltransferase